MGKSCYGKITEEIIKDEYNKIEYPYFTPVYINSKDFGIILNKYKYNNKINKRLKRYNSRKKKKNSNKFLIYNKDDIFKKNFLHTTVLYENFYGNIVEFICDFSLDVGHSIFGQDECIKIITHKLVRFNNNKYNKPIGNFILCGPSGTGKTEICKILSKHVGYGDMNLIKYDMSEFTGEQSISRLLGSPPGYVGHEKSTGMQTLVDKILNKPNSVVLLDEIEKAYKKICYIFLQVLDEGMLTDSRGNTGDFTNSFVIFTSNLGVSEPDENDIYGSKHKENIVDVVTDYFPPEFINRLDGILIFNYLNINSLYLISHKFIKNRHNNIKTKNNFNCFITLLSNSLSGGSRLLLNNMDRMLSSIRQEDSLFIDYKNQLLKCVVV